MLETFPVAVETRGVDHKCGLCTSSYCCTYITQRLPGPRSMVDFDHLLWQVSHENVEVYKDDEGWFLLVTNRCSHLRAGGRCGIYQNRPQVCRDHANDYCEYDAPAQEGFELYFNGYDSLLKYCKKRFKHWGSHRESGE